MEQDHRFMLAFKSFSTATSILAGVEAMHMIKKEQTFLFEKSVQKINKFK
ncbi:Transposase [Bacillus cereus R309803]|nr:Transposase [Bacillus cereus R309803]